MCWCEYAMDAIVLTSMSSRQKGLSFVLTAYRNRGRFPQLALGSPLNSMHRVQCLKKWSSAQDIAAIHIVTPYRTKPITAPNFHRALPVAPRLCAVKKRDHFPVPHRRHRNSISLRVRVRGRRRFAIARRHGSQNTTASPLQVGPDSRAPTLPPSPTLPTENPLNHTNMSSPT